MQYSFKIVKVNVLLKEIKLNKHKNETKTNLTHKDGS